MNPDQPTPIGNPQPTNRFFRPLYLVIAAVVIFLGVVVFFALGGHVGSGTKTGNGEVVVTTNDQHNDIILSSLTTQDTKTDTGSMDVTVPVGTYSVTVTNNQLSATQLIKVTDGQKTKVTINPGHLGTAEPVTDRATSSVNADAASLRYLDSATGKLYAVAPNNSEQLLAGGQAFSKVSWADSSYGVGQATSGQLFVIDGANVTALNSPISASNPKASFGVAPNRLIYVSDGSQILAGNAGATFKKIYQSAGTVTILAASNGAVAAGEGNATSPANGTVLTITPAGTVHTRSFAAYQAAWSPSGKYLVITGDDVTIVTDAALTQTGNIPASNVASPAWLDDDTVFYGITSGLWRFDTHSGRSDLLTNMPQGAYVSQIAPSRDGAYVYVLLQSTNHDGSDSFHLQRLGLKGQSVSGIATALSGLLPEPIGACTVGYLNFTQPNVEVRGPAGSAASCTQAAQAFIAPYASIIGSGYNYQFVAN